MNEMFYFDLSHNALTGKLPSNVDMIVLKHFLLDHNQFSGSIPSNYPRMGNSRFLTFYVNDNQLTGTFPRGPWNKEFPHRFLSTYSAIAEHQHAYLFANTSSLTKYLSFFHRSQCRYLQQQYARRYSRQCVRVECF